MPTSVYESMTFPAIMVCALRKLKFIKKRAKMPILNFIIVFNDVVITVRVKK
jgi:hypothetical protein